MSEIEKLYENAGCKKVFDCSECYKPCDNDICNFDGESKFASFTAGKQLELIKWLMVNNKDYQYDIEDNKYWFIIDDYRETKYREFDEALAELINLYWQDLTEEEKAEIKRILE